MKNFTDIIDRSNQEVFKEPEPIFNVDKDVDDEKENTFKVKKELPGIFANKKSSPSKAKAPQVKTFNDDLFNFEFDNTPTIDNKKAPDLLEHNKPTNLLEDFDL